MYVRLDENLVDVAFFCNNMILWHAGNEGELPYTLHM